MAWNDHRRAALPLVLLAAAGLAGCASNKCLFDGPAVGPGLSRLTSSCRDESHEVAAGYRRPAWKLDGAANLGVVPIHPSQVRIANVQDFDSAFGKTKRREPVLARVFTGGMAVYLKKHVRRVGFFDGPGQVSEPTPTDHFVVQATIGQKPFPVWAASRAYLDANGIKARFVLTVTNLVFERANASSAKLRQPTNPGGTPMLMGYGARIVHVRASYVIFDHEQNAPVSYGTTVGTAVLTGDADQENWYTAAESAAEGILHASPFAAP